MDSGTCTGSPPTHSDGSIRIMSLIGLSFISELEAVSRIFLVKKHKLLKLSQIIQLRIFFNIFMKEKQHNGIFLFKFFLKNKDIVTNGTYLMSPKLFPKKITL